MGLETWTSYVDVDVGSVEDLGKKERTDFCCQKCLRKMDLMGKGRLWQRTCFIYFLCRFICFVASFSLVLSLGHIDWIIGYSVERCKWHI